MVVINNVPGTFGIPQGRTCWWLLIMYPGHLGSLKDHFLASTVLTVDRLRLSATAAHKYFVY